MSVLVAERPQHREAAIIVDVVCLFSNCKCLMIVALYGNQVIIHVVNNSCEGIVHST